MLCGVSRSDPHGIARNTRTRSRNRAALALGVALLVFVPALLLPRTPDTLALRTILLAFSFFALAVCAIWLYFQWDAARRLMRLQAGIGVLARWTVDPARWLGFRTRSEAWDRLEGVKPNMARLSQDPGHAGIDIVVSREGVLIGDDFTAVDKDARVTVRADWMEFYQRIPKPNGSPMHLVLRMPLQAGREALAAEIEQAWREQARVAAQSGMGRLALLWMALGLLVGLPAVTLMVWLVLRLTGWVS